MKCLAKVLFSINTRVSFHFNDGSIWSSYIISSIKPAENGLKIELLAKSWKICIFKDVENDDSKMAWFLRTFASHSNMYINSGIKTSGTHAHTDSLRDRYRFYWKSHEHELSPISILLSSEYYLRFLFTRWRTLPGYELTFWLHHTNLIGNPISGLP